MCADYEFWSGPITSTLPWPSTPAVPAFLSLRDLWLYASLFDCELRALHIPGYTNIITDALSRWDTHPEFSIKFYDAASFHLDSLSENLCSFDLFRFECQW